MKITAKQIEALNPCHEGYQWYLQTIRTSDLLEVLRQTMERNTSWAIWLFIHLMTRDQKVEIAIYSAELVLHIFEEKYPDDNRPRQAIAAAKKYLNAPSEKNCSHAYAADYAAYAADAADYACAYAVDAYSFAAHASTAAIYAIDAADYAPDARKEMQEKIIRKAVQILEQEKETK